MIVLPEPLLMNCLYVMYKHKNNVIIHINTIKQVMLYHSLKRQKPFPKIVKRFRKESNDKMLSSVPLMLFVARNATLNLRKKKMK